MRTLILFITLLVLSGCMTDQEFHWQKILNNNSVPVPTQYQYVPASVTVIVTHHTRAELAEKCHWSPEAFACAKTVLSGTWCFVYLPLPEETSEEFVAYALKHELGHCAGWGKDHV